MQFFQPVQAGDNDFDIEPHHVVNVGVRLRGSKEVEVYGLFFVRVFCCVYLCLISLNWP